ncbi:hypothetical protein Goari_007027 [Gossypium aridum]|uniref:Uncharacterized protein n=1 Tax=Gossypium aridum TaxID=34290 RepID=A0A7J8XPZ0_GOSAI|nr:hypothetical protein [Gossypium aridum]
MRGQCFGFVRFPKFAEARGAIAKLNGYVVFGSDGSTIRGWKDFWVPEVGPLFSYVPAHSSLDLESTLRDWALLDGGEDRIIWARSGSGSFSWLELLEMHPRVGWLVIRLAIGFWALIIIWANVYLWRKNFGVFLMEFLFFLNKGYKKVRIQTDNLEVLRALSMEELVDSGITLRRRVKHFLHSDGQ